MVYACFLCWTTRYLFCPFIYFHFMGLIHCNTMGYKYTWWKQLQNILVLIRSLFLTHLLHTDSCGGMHPSACCLWSFLQDSSLMAPSLPESCTTSTYFGEILLQLSLHLSKKGSMLCPRGRSEGQKCGQESICSNQCHQMPGAIS